LRTENLRSTDEKRERQSKGKLETENKKKTNIGIKKSNLKKGQFKIMEGGSVK